MVPPTARIERCDRADPITRPRASKDATARIPLPDRAHRRMRPRGIPLPDRAHRRMRPRGSHYPTARIEGCDLADPITQPRASKEATSRIPLPNRAHRRKPPRGSHYPTARIEGSHLADPSTQPSASKRPTPRIEAPHPAAPITPPPNYPTKAPPAQNRHLSYTEHVIPTPSRQLIGMRGRSRGAGAAAGSTLGSGSSACLAGFELQRLEGKKGKLP